MSYSKKTKYPIIVLGVVIGIWTGFLFAEELAEGENIVHSVLEPSIYIFIYIFILILNHKLEKLIEKEHEDIKVKRVEPEKSLREKLIDWELSSSELEVFNALLSGKTINEISLQRHSSEKTIRAQLSSIYKKTGHKNKSELIAHYFGNKA